MACRKCGSGWTTIHGADRASCPECCKIARCVERKAGRYRDPVQVKQCVECGSEFAATGLADIAKRSCCTSACQESHRAKALRSYRRRYESQTYKAAKSEASPAPRKRDRPRCAMCGNECKSENSKKYCSRKCFYDARAAGIQAWDRSAIEDAAKNRPNNVSQSPWRYFAQRCSADMRGFLRKATTLYRPKDSSDCLVAKRTEPVMARAVKAMLGFLGRAPSVGRCPVCDCSFIRRPRQKIPHCSMKCAVADAVDASCSRCGRVMKIGFLGGNVEERKRKPLCKWCVIHRSNHSKKRRGCKGRCQKFGVPFDPSVKPHMVFERDRFVCHICKRKTLAWFTLNGRIPHPLSPTVDHHPYPLSAGIKGHEWDNVRCACWDCNTRKGARWSGQIPLALSD
jgi:hypothetical protein